MLVHLNTILVNFKGREHRSELTRKCCRNDWYDSDLKL